VSAPDKLVTHEGPAKVAQRRVVRPTTADTLQDAGYLRAFTTAQELLSEWLEDDSVESLIRHWEKTINHLESAGFDEAAVPCRGYRDALVEYRDDAGRET
jgi:hypothetical protein